MFVSFFIEHFSFDNKISLIDCNNNEVFYGRFHQLKEYIKNSHLPEDAYIEKFQAGILFSMIKIANYSLEGGMWCGKYRNGYNVD